MKELAQRMRGAIESVPAGELPIAMSRFPDGACGDASLLLGAYFVDCGFQKFEFVSAERGAADIDTWTSHAWLECERLIVDITADQFSDAPGAVVVAYDSGWHARFRTESRGPADFREWTGMGTVHLHQMYSRLHPYLFSCRRDAQRYT